MPCHLRRTSRLTCYRSAAPSRPPRRRLSLPDEQRSLDRTTLAMLVDPLPPIIRRSPVTPLGVAGTRCLSGPFSWPHPSSPGAQRAWSCSSSPFSRSAGRSCRTPTWSGCSMQQPSSSPLERGLPSPADGPADRRHRHHEHRPLKSSRLTPRRSLHPRISVGVRLCPSSTPYRRVGFRDGSAAAYRKFGRLTASKRFVETPDHNFDGVTDSVRSIRERDRQRQARPPRPRAPHGTGPPRRSPSAAPPPGGCNSRPIRGRR